MRRLAMRGTDLGELYVLLEMYRRVYGGVPEKLLEEVEKEYESQRAVEGKDKCGIRNPRGAGRKSNITEERIRKAKELKEKGYRMREIGKEMGCSLGHVHKLIHEQPNKQSKK